MSSSDGIELDIDSYGLEARESALADLVEWRALLDYPMTLADLADYVGDCDWGRFDPDPYSAIGDDGSGGEASEDADHAWAQRAFDLITERIHVLGGEYPFELQDDGRLVFRGPENWQSSYLALLVITTSHALSLGVEINVTQLFEAVVAATIKKRGFLVAEMAKARRDGDDFVEALERCCAAVNLRATPSAASFKKRAQDEGVDVISHLWWGDDRPGRWVFLGQVTCGKSNTWYYKSTDPGVGRWRGLLGMHVNPHVFLAVPHHVPEHTAADLAQDHEGAMLLDRLRICAYKADLLPDEEVLIESVASIAKPGEG